MFCPNYEGNIRFNSVQNKGKQFDSNFPITKMIDTNSQDVLIFQFKHNKLILNQSLEYNVIITNSIASISFIQYYINKSDLIVDLEYQFETSPIAVFHSFEAITNDKIIKSIVKEKNLPNCEIQNTKQNRQTVSKILSKGLIIQLSNIFPHQSICVKLKYAQQLQICQNYFWNLTLYLDPNNPTTELILTIISTNNIEFCKSPTHQIEVNFESPTKLNINQKVDFKNGNFILLFKNTLHQKPSLILSKPICQNSAYCAQISLIPQTNLHTAEDSYLEYSKNMKNELDINLSVEKYDFIFLLDRSGSMHGDRIEKAKEALIFFLKSLPQYSYFSVYSFGSNYELLCQSQQLTDEAVMQAIDLILTFQADLKGTNILEPLTIAYMQQLMNGYRRNIFILTDGEIINEDKVFELIKLNSTFESKLYIVGIGYGCSYSFIRKAAKIGKGSCRFLYDNDDFAEKVINLLEESLQSFILNFNIEFDNLSCVEKIIPDPSTFIGKKLNKAIVFYLFLNQNLTVLNLKFQYQFSNSELCFYEENICNEYAIFNDDMHRLAGIKIIKQIENASLRGETQIKILQKTLLFTEKELIDFLINLNIVSDKTAFFIEIHQKETNNYYQKEQIQIQFCKPEKFVTFSNVEVFYFETYKTYQQNEANSFKKKPSLFGRICKYFNCLKKPKKNQKKLTYKQNEKIFQYQICEDIKKKQKEQSFDLLNIIKEQQINGCFRFNKKMLEQMQISQNKYLEASFRSLDIYMTILTVSWLSKRYSHRKQAYKLILQKSMDYLNQQHLHDLQNLFSIVEGIIT